VGDGGAGVGIAVEDRRNDEHQHREQASGPDHSFCELAVHDD